MLFQQSAELGVLRSQESLCAAHNAVILVRSLPNAPHPSSERIEQTTWTSDESLATLTRTGWPAGRISAPSDLTMGLGPIR